MTEMRRLRLTMSIIASLSFVLVLAPLGLTNNNASFAQMPNATNQTTANMTGQPETTVLNKTTIPAQQTNVTVNQTTKPVSQQALQPLENLTQSQAATNLSGIQNKTMVAPTGNATTTVVNKTTVPFNQTMVTGGSNQSQQQSSNAATTTPPPSTSNASGGNQSQQQGGENPLSKVPVLGKLFGGK
jgi:hypothetical protein